MSARQIVDLTFRRPLLVVAAVAVVPRVLLAALINRADIWALAPDSVQYLAVTEAAADGRLATFWVGYGESLFKATWVFSAQLWALFELFGPSRFAGQCVAIVYGVLSAVMAVVVARRVVRPAYAISAGLVVALLPSQIAFSSVTLRESLIWWLLAMTVFFVFRSGRSVHAAGSIGWMVATSIPILLLAYLRVHAALLLTWCLFGCLLFVGRARLVRSLIVGLFVVVLPMFMGLGPGGVDFAIKSADNLGTVRAVLAMSADTAIGEVVAPKIPEVRDEDGWLISKAVPADLDEQGGLEAVVGDESFESVAAAGGVAGSVVSEVTGVEVEVEVEVGVAPPLDDQGFSGNKEFSVEPRDLSALGGDPSVEPRGLSALGGDPVGTPLLPGVLLDRAIQLGEGNRKFIVDSEGRSITVSNDRLATFSALPRGLAAVMFRPFPWEADGSIGQTGAALESLAWMLLVLLSIVGIAARWRSSVEVIFLVLLVSVFAGASAVTQGNVGTAFRHRGQILLGISVLAVAGIQHIRDRWLRDSEAAHG
ncbi:MAG: hypothetical protein P8M16_06610 [Acidimicrobiales bacterium]|nr:hypothetical protein [Acidimicrobiales bacterium]